MKDDLAESLRIKNTPPPTHTHTHTKNKPTISTSTIARALVGILITINLQKMCLIREKHNSRVDKQRNEPGRWKSRIVAIFLLFLTLLHVLT